MGLIPPQRDPCTSVSSTRRGPKVTTDQPRFRSDVSVEPIRKCDMQPPVPQYSEAADEHEKPDSLRT